MDVSVEQDIDLYEGENGIGSPNWVVPSTTKGPSSNPIKR